MPELSEHAIDLPVRPEAALSALRDVADDWGAELEERDGQTRLLLPVVYGLKRGLMSGPVRVEPAENGGGSTLLFEVEETQLYRPATPVIILAIAVAGGIVTALWPFFPKLLPLAPFGAILALGGWFLVVSRLRTSGPDEMLTLVAAQAAAEDEDAPAAEE